MSALTFKRTASSETIRHRAEQIRAYAELVGWGPEVMGRMIARESPEFAESAIKQSGQGDVTFLDVEATLYADEDC